MSRVQIFLLVVGLILVAGFLVDRLLLWMERRGWITWRRLRAHIHTSGGGLRGAMGSLQELVQPELRHAHEDVEQRAAARADADTPDGCPPSPALNPTRLAPVSPPRASNGRSSPPTME